MFFTESSAQMISAVIVSDLVTREATEDPDAEFAIRRDVPDVDAEEVMPLAQQLDLLLQ